ncbi:MAG: hypothetical protein OFPII_43100 [Osedax symbiont Rs1]|nr:MAG: hypothetical protein OFPII_43100 [Osedax symbiont Rs1]
MENLEENQIKEKKVDITKKVIMVALISTVVIIFLFVIQGIFKSNDNKRVEEVAAVKKNAEVETSNKGLKSSSFEENLNQYRKNKPLEETNNQEFSTYQGKSLSQWEIEEINYARKARKKKQLHYVLKKEQPKPVQVIPRKLPLNKLNYNRREHEKSSKSIAENNKVEQELYDRLANLNHELGKITKEDLIKMKEGKK